MCLAVPGKLKSVEGSGFDRQGSVDFGGIMRKVSLVFLPQARPGDFVIVHAGIAISKVDETAAYQALDFYTTLNEKSILNDTE